MFEFERTERKTCMKNTLKVGDEVYVTRKAKSYENGWNNVWVPSAMNCYVGKIGRVKAIYEDIGIELDFGDGMPEYLFPSFVLKKISPIQEARDIAKKISKRNGFVTIDEVHSALKETKFGPITKGAAGAVFNTPEFINTGVTVKSVRPENRGRRISIWKLKTSDRHGKKTALRSGG